MSRRHRAEKREVLPDPKFGDRVLTKFMNNLMIDGKKSVAERIVYGAFDRSKAKCAEPVEVFHRRWTIGQALPLKSARAALVVPPTRCRSKCAPSAVRRWRSAGSSTPLRGRNENTMVERLPVS
jgi:small subunit ribosomal protein S7